MDQIKKIGEEMISQDKRCTSWVYFIIVEDKKIYGIDSDFSEGTERKDTDSLDFGTDICEKCLFAYEKDGYLPDQCDADDCESSFITYRVEHYVPNLYAGFFFTAKAAEEHLKNKRHHYNSTAIVYGESACYNHELQTIMTHLVGKENVNKLY